MSISKVKLFGGVGWDLYLHGYEDYQKNPNDLEASRRWNHFKKKYGDQYQTKLDLYLKTGNTTQPKMPFYKSKGFKIAAGTGLAIGGALLANKLIKDRRRKKAEATMSSENLYSVIMNDDELRLFLEMRELH